MEKKTEPMIVAHIMGKWLGGGVEAVVMNYYRHIDRNKIQFDFICDSDSTDIPYDEIKKLGGRVILVPPYQQIFKYIKELKKIFQENRYQIVHSHINTLSVFPLYAAKKSGIPVRIAHSHSTTNKREKKKNLMKQLLRVFSKVYATDYMCCSEHAGRWLFGDKEYDKGNVYLLNNAIDIEKFKYDEKLRRKKRKELEIDDDTLVIGHIGRFVEQKNHRFLIDIFNEIHQKNKNSILLLVGQGPLMKEIKDKVEKLNLSRCVKFLGQRNDVNQLYNAMDVFLFPSLYEGLGMVLIEAQVNGLPCLASSEVPQTAKITNIIDFIDLKEDRSIWVEKILNTHSSRRLDFFRRAVNSKYNIANEAVTLEKYYVNKKNLKKVAVITSGFLPVPATSGGAVENLIENILVKNEENKKMQLLIFSIYDQKAILKCQKYSYSKFQFIEVPLIIKILDSVTFFIAKNIVKKKNSQSYRYIFQRLHFLNQVSLCLKKNNYDKIILENHPSQYLALKWRKNYIKYRDKFYYHCHNEFPGTYGCKKIIKETKKFICVSEYISKELQKYLKLEKDKFYVLRNCIDTKIFQKKLNNKEEENLRKKYQILPTDKIILFAGRIVPEKGVKELIEAILKLNQKNYKLLVIGSALNSLSLTTNYQKEIEKLVEKMGNNVIFTGFIQYSEMYKYYSLADLAVLPSIWDDPAPLTIIESLVSGLPIITTNSGGIPEYARNDSAIILNKNSYLIEAIATNIAKLLGNSEKLREMSINAKEVSKNLTLENYYFNFYKLIEK